MSYTLPRSERLRSLKAIRRMFGEGHSGFIYPFRYVWIATEPCGEGVEPQQGSERGVEVMFSVPKKFHKRANKRNLLKRRMREAYRLNNSELKSLCQSRGVAFDIAFIYSSKEVLPSNTIAHAITKILAEVAERA